LKKKQRKSSARILKIDPYHPSPEALRNIVGVLRRGGLVAFPTETFYALCADILNEAAVKRLYQVKGRSNEQPTSVIVHDEQAALSLVADASASGRKIMEAFWPGPITLLFLAQSGIPRRLLGEDGTLGVRVPDHEGCLALLRAWGGALTATSANRSGESSPDRAEQVIESLGSEIDLIVDGGVSEGGDPSTIVDVTYHPPRLVRPGRIPFSDVMKTVGITLTDEHDW